MHAVTDQDDILLYKKRPQQQPDTLYKHSDNFTMHSTCIIKPGLTALHTQLSKSFLHNTILPTTPRAIWGGSANVHYQLQLPENPLPSTVLASPRALQNYRTKGGGGRICKVCSKSGDLASSAGQLLGPLASYSHNKHSRPSNLLQHTLTCPRQPRGAVPDVQTASRAPQSRPKEKK